MGCEYRRDRSNPRTNVLEDMRYQLSCGLVVVRERERKRRGRENNKERRIAEKEVTHDTAWELNTKDIVLIDLS